MHENRLPVVTLDPMLEHGLVDAIRPTESGPILAADPETTERVMSSITQAVRDVEQTGRRPVLGCSAGLRRPLRRPLRTVDPDLAVTSYADPARPSSEHSRGGK